MHIKQSKNVVYNIIMEVRDYYIFLYLSKLPKLKTIISDVT